MIRCYSTLYIVAPPRYRIIL